MRRVTVAPARASGHCTLRDHSALVGEATRDSINREATLELLQQLRSISVAEHDEVMNFIRGRALHGRGMGDVDAHLLAAVAIAGYQLWTNDKRLRQIAAGLGLAAL